MDPTSVYIVYYQVSTAGVFMNGIDKKTPLLTQTELNERVQQPGYRYYNAGGIWMKFINEDKTEIISSLNKFVIRNNLVGSTWSISSGSTNENLNRYVQYMRDTDFSNLFYNIITHLQTYYVKNGFDSIIVMKDDNGIYRVEIRKTLEKDSINITISRG